MITLNQITGQKEKIHKIAQQYHAENIRVFGSVARGDSNEKSDIDLLVNFLPGASLFDQVAITVEIEELFHCKVDVISERSINPAISSKILKRSCNHMKMDLKKLKKINISDKKC